MEGCIAILNKFKLFITNEDKDITTLEEVKQRQAVNFMTTEENRGIFAKTYNDTLKFLKSAWNKLLPGFLFLQSR